MSHHHLKADRLRQSVCPPLRLDFVNDFKFDLKIANESGLGNILIDLRNLKLGNSRSFTGQDLPGIRIDDIPFAAKYGYLLSDSHTTELPQRETET